MKFKKYQALIVVRILLQVLISLAMAYLLLQGKYFFSFCVFILLVVQVVELFKFISKNNEELERFVESIQYRDFSRHFDTTNAPLTVKDLRKGFNQINATFKIISRERETQFQYLQQILEIVDTGILSYEASSGEVFWLNEGFKKMMSIPYLKTIHSLQKRDEPLYKEIIGLKNGQQKVVTAHNERSGFKVLIAASAFQTDEKIYRLIAFQNINEALDENEAEAWKKLLSVMTHEIMNSIAPISSLANTLKTRLQQLDNGMAKDNAVFEDLDIGIETIRHRSEGLLKFAETYRNLNKITVLNLKQLHIRDLFENLQQLLQPTFEEKKIRFEIILKEPGLSLQADASLLEQVLINLLVNAIDAVKDKADGWIELSAYSNSNHKIAIKVSDNGSGIPEALLDKIFIPFFSTRKTGSGIGLSLCKQIMMLHKGNIEVQSVEGKGSIFTVQLNEVN